MSIKDSLDDIKDDGIKEIVAASEDPEETIRQLSDQLRARQKQLEQEHWDRCRFCECGADSVLECSCDTEKKWGWMERTSRKINKELGELAVSVSILKTEYGLNRGDE